MRELKYRLTDGTMVGTLAMVSGSQYDVVMVDIGEGKAPLTPMRKAILESGKCVIPKSR